MRTLAAVFEILTHPESQMCDTSRFSRQYSTIQKPWQYCLFIMVRWYRYHCHLLVAGLEAVDTLTNISTAIEPVFVLNTRLSCGPAGWIISTAMSFTDQCLLQPLILHRILNDPYFDKDFWDDRQEMPVPRLRYFIDYSRGRHWRTPETAWPSEMNSSFYKTWAVSGTRETIYLISPDILTPLNHKNIAQDLSAI